MGGTKSFWQSQKKKGEGKSTVRYGPKKGVKGIAIEGITKYGERKKIRW